MSNEKGNQLISWNAASFLSNQIISFDIILMRISSFLELNRGFFLLSKQEK